MTMLYPELFKQLEAVRWNMDTDIAWEKFDAALLTVSTPASSATSRRKPSR